MFVVTALKAKCLLAGALLALAFVVGVASGLYPAPAPASAVARWNSPANVDPVVRSPQIAVVNMLRQRFETLMDGDLERIRPNYRVEYLGGEYAWLKERDRTTYFRAWLAERGLVLESASTWFEVDSVISLGRGSYRMEVTEHGLYRYRPEEVPGTPGDPAPTSHTFGSRTVHVLEAALDGSAWKIAYDWYLDPLGDSASLPGKGRIVPSATQAQPGPAARAQPDADPSAAQKFDRRKAADYALRHAGVRSLPGGGKYNRAYQVYSYIGGDCANFASQALAAGGLPQDYGWGYCRGGSSSWTCSEDLIWHLLGSGAGRRVYRGDLAGALLPLPNETRRAIDLLQPGDVIGYESGGELGHVAVVTGLDPSGWPVIASHTADRLYFPWDLGWDRDTAFWFVHIVY